MQRLFGHLCSGNEFSHDAYMRKTLEDTDDEGNHRGRKRARYGENTSTQSTQATSQADESQSALLPEDGKIHGQSDADRPFQSTLDPSSHPSSLRQPSPSKVQLGPHPTRVSPDSAHQEIAKRAEVHRAHQYLQEHADPDLIRIGPLDHSGPNSKQSSGSKELGKRSPSPPPPSTTQQDSQKTDITSLSIPESALSISPPPQNKSSNRNALDQDDEAEENLHSTRGRFKERRRARITAFLAAREDSWVDVSLTSAGNNHAEEEMEL